MQYYRIGNNQFSFIAWTTNPKSKKYRIQRQRLSIEKAKKKIKERHIRCNNKMLRERAGAPGEKG